MSWPGGRRPAPPATGDRRGHVMRGLTKGYLIRRLGMYVLTVWLGATLIFIIPRLAPGDPIAAMVSRMQNQAGHVENSAAIIEAWRARFGLAAALPWTIGLLALATLISFVIGNLIGALMAWRPAPALVRRLLPLSLTFT